MSWPEFWQMYVPGAIILASIVGCIGVLFGAVFYFLDRSR